MGFVYSNIVFAPPSLSLIPGFLGLDITLQYG